MRQTILSTVGALFLSSGLFAADSQLMNLVMPDAQVMAGLNVTTAKTSLFGQFLLTKLASQGGTQFEALSSATGFDPRRDLVEVLAATRGGAGQKTGLVLAKGSFNVSQLTDAFSKEGHGAQVSSYGGATLISGKDGKSEGAVAFLGTSIAIAGDLESVRGAIDRSGQNNSVSAELAAKVQTLSGAQDAWAVSLEPVSGLLPKADSGASGPAAQANQILKTILAANGGVKFGSLIVVTAQAVASDAKNAGALADVVRLLAGMAAMAGQQNAQLGQVLQSLQVATDGSAVNVSLSLPETVVEQMLNGAGGAQANVRRGN